MPTDEEEMQGTSVQWRANQLDIYSLSDKTSNRQISRSLEATRLAFMMIISLWNLPGI